MKTETSQQPAPIQPRLSPITKQDLATDIRKYIIHCRYIILNSPNPAYRNMRILSHLELCEVHSKWLKNVEGVSSREISQMTLILKRHLEGILPNPTNNSYDTALHNLNSIVESCKTILNKEK